MISEFKYFTGGSMKLVEIEINKWFLSNPHVNVISHTSHTNVSQGFAIVSIIYTYE